MCVALVTPLTEKMAARSFAYHAHMMEQQTARWQILLLSMALLAQARPQNDKSSASITQKQASCVISKHKIRLLWSYIIAIFG